MNVLFCSCFLDHSGYAQAARNLLMSMISVGINVKTEIVTYQTGRQALGEGCEEAKKRQNLDIPYDIKLIMLTPEQAILRKENNKYNIELLFWEVLGVDQRWVNYMNQMNAICTTSKIFAKTFLDSGVTVPIRVIAQPIKLKEKQIPINIKEHNGFLFYSIFQWTERKNPKSLLTSYWKTFANNEDVALLLKTYRSDFSPMEKQAVKNDILRWKDELKLKRYPKVLLSLNELSVDEIVQLHLRGDVFVSAHRGEGWGYPQMEAMSFGKPIISTNFGGIHELLDDKNAWLIDYKLTNVFNMGHIEWYNTKQLWASPNEESISKAMLEAYTNREKTKEKGKRALEFVKNNLLLRHVGEDIKEKLEKIKI